MAFDRTFLKAGAKAEALEAATLDRVMDAQVLFDAGRFASAVAMGIYAVEMGLKVAICRRLSLDALPKAFEIHDLESLLLLAGLQARIATRRNLRVFANWNRVLDQSTQLNELRYRPASELALSAPNVTEFLGSIANPPHGVLPWLAKQA